jgi:nitrous oxidase accessory protein NosD
VIQGNFIGTDVSGTSTNDNYMGIYISQGAQGTLIGGTAAGAGNLISANDSEGIFISGSSDNVIQGNFIGTDVT